jgi:hypothetical protein
MLHFSELAQVAFVELEKKSEICISLILFTTKDTKTDFNSCVVYLCTKFQNELSVIIFITPENYVAVIIVLMMGMI